jgi:hypothetical protein
MAGEPGIQEFFEKLWQNVPVFTGGNRFGILFLLVFGDMRTHHVYQYNHESGRFKPEYEEYYRGNKNYNMVITDRCLYFGDDLDQKKGVPPVRIPLYK